LVKDEACEVQKLVLGCLANGMTGCGLRVLLQEVGTDCGVCGASQLFQGKQTFPFEPSCFQGLPCFHHTLKWLYRCLLAQGQHQSESIALPCCSAVCGQHTAGRSRGVLLGFCPPCAQGLSLPKVSFSLSLLAFSPTFS